MAEIDRLDKPRMSIYPEKELKAEVARMKKNFKRDNKGKDVRFIDWHIRICQRTNGEIIQTDLSVNFLVDGQKVCTAMVL